MRSLLLASLVSLASVAVAQSPLGTVFVGNTVRTNTDTVNTVFVDLTVTAPTGLIITRFDINGAGLSATSALDVYMTATPGTHVGNQSNAAAWTLKGTCPQVTIGTQNSATSPHFAVLDRGIYVAPGTYGLALHLKNWRHVYTPITVPAQPTVWTSAEMSLDTIAARIQTSTLAAPFSGASSSPRTPNLAVHYQTTSAPAFSATPRAGTGPLNVTFTDQSVSMDLGGIVAWAWDLDGDNIDDAFVQNPTRSYNCGTYSVRLTAFDALGFTQTTKTDYIVVDALTSNFTWQKIAEPATFQFTSQSSATATTFAWDLNGDTVVDSNLQNPTFSYAPGCAPVPVTLTVTNSCRTVSRTIQVAPSSTILTTLAANNAGATGYAVNFDANVTATDGIEVCGVYVNVNVGTGGAALTCDIYTRNGTYVGNDLSPTGWNLVTGTGTAEVIGVPTYIQLASPIYLTPGIHGFTVVLNGAGLAYTNGTGANQTYTNADVTLTLGQVRTIAFNNTSTLFTPRVFNGRLNYSTAATGMAGYYTYGAGCAGSLGIPGNSSSAFPRLGQNMVVDHNNTPAGVIPFLGFSNTLFQGFPLPIDAGPLGAPGCPILQSADINAGLAFAVGGVSTWSIFIPNDPVFVGVHIYTQAFSFDGINALGGAFSDAAAGLIGN
ncbi:MAG: PKD domain-containing protein [Planctomycetota bacterium]